MPSRLNTTDFAILGLLARRPWSAYEMTQYMRNSNVRAVWPRAESRIYESPKKLASLGFASASTEQHGKRSRAIYEITPEGRAALREWLEEEGKGFGIEYEALLKLDLADISDTALQSRLLAQVVAQGNADWQEIEGFFRMFAGGESSEASIDRRAQNLLINAFLWELLSARQRWARFAQAFSDSYADCASDDQREELVLRSYTALLEED
jgi:DNA-binding PadR family transcriptional regulator